MIQVLIDNRRYINRILVCLVLSLLAQVGVSQKSEYIKSIEFQGTKRTKSSYLNRFTKTQTGLSLDSIQLENDLRKLRTLPPVMHVEAISTTSDSGINLVYKIEERFTLFPVGDFGLTEDNFWIGGGLMESNLLGRGLYAYGYYQYNSTDNPHQKKIKNTLHFIFRNPYIVGSKWGMELQIKNLPAIENSAYWSEQLLIDFFNLSIAARYEFEYENDILLGTSYRRESANNTLNASSDVYTPINLNRNTQELFVRHEIRKLDYHGFYVSGWKNVAHLSFLIPYNSDDNTIVIFQNELKYYIRIKSKGNLALRAKAGTSSLDWNFFHPFIADSYYNFRGIGYRAYRGNRIALINLEYRQTLYENKWGGIQAVIFNDSGIIGEVEKIFDFELSSESPGFQSYGGLGMRFIYKKAYDAILCIDYGVDLQDPWNGGLVLGWGQYF